jgi:hypothetical protein
MAIDTTVILRRNTALNLWAPTALADAVGVLKNDGAGNLTWGTGGGGITGPVSSTITALVRWDDALGTAVRDSNVTLANSGTALVFSGAGGISAGGSNQNVTLTPSGTGKSVLAGLVQLSSLGVGVLQSDASGNISSNTSVTSSALTQATARILGRSTAGLGAIEEITIGSGLTLAAGSLAAAGGSGDFTGPASATDHAVVRFDGTTGKLGEDSLLIVDDSGNISDGGTLPGSTMLYFERSGLAIGEFKSTGNDARLRLRRADTSKGAMIEFIRGTTDEFYMGTPYTAATPDGSGNQFVIQYYSSSEITLLGLTPSGVLSLPQIPLTTGLSIAIATKSFPLTINGTVVNVLCQ